MSKARGADKLPVVVRWLAVQADDPAAPAWRDLIDGEEQARADRFRFAADRLAYMAAHALLRRMLADIGGLEPNHWRFQTEPGGRPVLDPAHAQLDLFFSISHTRGMVACAVARRAALGVDVEGLARTTPVLEIAHRYFAASEAAWLASLAPAEQPGAFIRLWTLKEAYVKATGRGLAEPLDAFALSLDPPAIHFPSHDGDPSVWRFAEHQPSADHRLGLAVRSPEPGSLALDAGAITDSSLS